MLNLLEKLHSLSVSDKVRIWQYAGKKDGPQFYYWLIDTEPDNKEGYSCNTLEELIEKAYAHIDPLLKSMPKPTEPTFVSK